MAPDSRFALTPYPGFRKSPHNLKRSRPRIVNIHIFEARLNNSVHGFKEFKALRNEIQGLLDIQRIEEPVSALIRARSQWA